MPLDLEINNRIHPEPHDPYELECIEKLQPGEYEIYSEKLNQLVLEAKEVLTRIGISSMLHSGDIIVGLYTAKGDLVAAYCGVYLHAVTTQIAIKYMLKHFQNDPTVGIREGDIFYANEALYGGVHNPDQAAIMPIFYEGELIAWAASAVHQPETGAIEPGGMPVKARSRSDEGMKLPPIKIGENYQIRNDMLDMMANMVSRAPRMQIVDTKARVAACDRLRVRIQELVAKKGVDLVIGVMHKMLIVAEEGTRKRIASWEDGTYRSVVFLDSVGIQESLVRTVLTLKKKGDTLTFDFAGTSPENDGSFNSFLHIVRAHIAIYLFGVPFADLPTASGIFSPINITVPQGTFLNANIDASVANSPITNSVTLSAVSNTMSKLLFASGQHELATGGFSSSGCGFVVAGLNQWGVPFADLIANVLNSEGGGARSNRDGNSSFGFPWGWWGKAPDTEDLENEQPHVHLFFKHAKDSMGYGKYRGGAGTTVAWAVHSVPYLIYQSITKNFKLPIAQGLFGGYPPTVHPGIKISNANYFEKMAGGDADLPTNAAQLAKERTIQGNYCIEGNIRFAEPVGKGDIYVGNSVGGAGYGDVLDRDAALVMEDVRNEMLSDWTARHIFKVVYDPETWTVDEEQTELARKQEREARKRRGKHYAEFEAEWLKKQPAESSLAYYGKWPTAEPMRPIIRM
jgi:N-methylhydantoinase B/oxoprolinase/acetone carboxylase alpha subunit